MGGPVPGRPGRVQTTYDPAGAAADPLLSPRADVANAIAFRRRKGTPGVLSDLARAVGRWPAVAVELADRVARFVPVREAADPAVRPAPVPWPPAPGGFTSPRRGRPARRGPRSTGPPAWWTSAGRGPPARPDRPTRPGSECSSTGLRLLQSSGGRQPWSGTGATRSTRSAGTPPCSPARTRPPHPTTRSDCPARSRGPPSRPPSVGGRSPSRSAACTGSTGAWPCTCPPGASGRSGDRPAPRRAARRSSRPPRWSGPT